MFKGFKPQGLQKIANSMGYTGSLEGFDSYLQQNPDKQNMMNMYTQRAVQMARGGAVRRMQVGGMTAKTQMVGEDDNNPQMPKRVGAVTRAMGEDGSGAVAEIKTMAVGEDDGDMGGNLIGKLPTRPSITQAIGEDGSGDAIARPIGLTRAMGEDGTGPQPTVKTLAAGEDDGGLFPIDPRQPKQIQAPTTTLGTGAGQVDAYGDVATTTTDADGNVVQGTRPANIADVTAKMAQTGAIPEGAVTKVETIQTDPRQEIATGTGEVGAQTDATVTTAGTAQAGDAQQVTAAQMEAETVTDKVTDALQANQAAQTDPNDPRAQVTAAQQTKSSVGDLDAAQGNAYIMENPVQREIQAGELISGAADAEKAAKFTEQIEAATATPTEKATVQGQLAQLTADFDMSNPPPWAAGALRGVQAQLQKRGLGASSVAGQALIQGALESALPIAQADANIQAQFETQNLSNRQQRAMLAAQQRATFMGMEFEQEFQARVQNSARIGDIANMNFTAEQNIAMENSRAVNTMNLQNLNNRQAMVMAEAAALSQLDMANLSNNQQAAVQNAQNFLQMEMANLSNEQQTALFNAQAINQSLLTDQAATNAAAQFNATSQQQTDQFMANLANNISQFNATQSNAQAQFNAGEANTIERFNAEVRNQRDQFNANNQLAIAQSNAVWRREIATADTAAINRANELNAKAVLDVSNTAYNNMWSFYSDTVEWAWKSAESELDRINAIAIAEISKEAQEYAANATKSAAGKKALGGIIGSIFSSFG